MPQFHTQMSTEPKSKPNHWSSLQLSEGIAFNAFGDTQDFFLFGRNRGG